MTFIADEILEIAEFMERNGARFYRAAAQDASGAAKEFMLELAEMEDDHEKFFHEMREALTPEQKLPVTADPEDLGSKYLKSLIDGKVFDYRGDPLDKLKQCESLEEVLILAICLEKETIGYYLAVKDSVPGQEDRERIDRIIEEEKKHVVTLTDELNKLS
jgi:rubrerythrin